MPSKQQGLIDPARVALARGSRLGGASEARAKELLDALCDPTRLRILQALIATPLASSDIAFVVGRSRPATSQHLRLLRETRIVITERRGNIVRYRLADVAGVVQRIVNTLDELR